MNSHYLFANQELFIFIGIGAVLLIAAIIVLVVVLKSIGAKKIVTDAEDRFIQIHDRLTVELYNHLKRVGSIAKANSDFESIYTSNNNLYNSIIEHEDSIAGEAIKQIKDLLDDKKYDEIRLEVEQVNVALKKLDEKSKSLKEALSKTVEEDEANRQEIIKHRRFFHEVKGKYEAKKGELKYIDSTFERFFKNVELEFIAAEKSINAAKYEEASEKFPDINNVLEVVNKALDTLPKLVTSAFVVIPNVIKEMKDKYNVMIQEGYPLHHIRINSITEQLNNELVEVQTKLAKLSLRNVENDLMSIREEVINVTSLLEEEENAKKYFNENYSKIYNASNQVANGFLKLRRLVPNYKDTYLLKDSYLDTLQQVQKDITDLDHVKRNVDTYVHSNNLQPYTTIATRLEELERCTTDIENTMNAMKEYLVSLRTRTEDAHAYISNTYIELKKIESKVRKISINELTRLVSSNFDMLYELLNTASEIIIQKPIAIDKIDEIIADINQIKEGLDKKLLNFEENVKNAEEFVVRANAYRSFLDVQNDIVVAEKAFFEADFSRTIDEAGKIIKKFKAQLDE